MFSEESQTAEEESVTEEEDDEGDVEDQEKKSSVSWFLCSFLCSDVTMERKSQFILIVLLFFLTIRIKNRKQSPWSWRRSCLISWSTARVSTSVGLRIPGTSSPFMRWPPSKREKLWNWRRNQVWCHYFCRSDTTRAIKHMRSRLGLCPEAQIYYAAKYTVRNLHNVTDDVLHEGPLTQLWIWKRAGD